MVVRKERPLIEDLEIIQEETLEYVRANSQSTFRTPREISEQLLISMSNRSGVVNENRG